MLATSTRVADVVAGSAACLGHVQPLEGVGPPRPPLEGAPTSSEPSRRGRGDADAWDSAVAVAAARFHSRRKPQRQLASKKRHRRMRVGGTVASRHRLVGSRRRRRRRQRCRQRHECAERHAIEQVGELRLHAAANTQYRRGLAASVVRRVAVCNSRRRGRRGGSRGLHAGRDYVGGALAEFGVRVAGRAGPLADGDRDQGARSGRCTPVGSCHTSGARRAGIRMGSGRDRACGRQGAIDQRAELGERVSAATRSRAADR
mmetsp:Transcript_42817/g.123792  ORF Transcript_42817/g.123792 Transcript_42817/m.123792 type:complete len:260 (+) Transcript_42817:697-1476(+)